MPVTAMMVLGPMIGGGISALGSYFGSQQQAGTAQQALGLQQQLFGKAQTALQPFIQTGASAADIMKGLLTPGGNAPDIWKTIPGAQEMLNFGLQGVQNYGTTTGLGGNTGTALARYATDYGLSNVFSPIMTSLLGLSNVGGGAASSLAGAASGFGQTMGTTLSGLGSARAAGTLGATNAIAGGVQSAAYAPLLTQMLQRYAQQPNVAPGQYGTPNVWGSTIPYVNGPFQTAQSPFPQYA